MAAQVPLRYLVSNVVDRVDESDDAPYVGLEAVESGTGRLVPEHQAGNRQVESGGGRFRAGDVLYGKLRPYLKKSWLATFSGVASSEFLNLQADRVRLDPRYLAYAMLSDDVSQRSVANSYGTKMPRTNWDEVGDLQLWVPGLEEQRRIADMLDHETARIDTLIAKNERLLALVSERRGETVAVGVTENGRSDRVRQVELGWTDRVADADDWSVAPLTAIARTGTGHTPSRSEDDYWQDCTIPWLTTGDVGAFRNGRVESITTTAEMVSELGVQNSSAVVHPAGTVALSRTASVGFSVIMGADMATSQDFFTWTCGPGLLPHYLLYVLRAMKHRGHFDRLMYGSTHKTIYVPDLMGLRTPLPPVSVQHGIVERLQHELSALDDLSDGMLAQTALLRERREALITAAVTGEIDPSTVRNN